MRSPLPLGTASSGDGKMGRRDQCWPFVWEWIRKLKKYDQWGHNRILIYVGESQRKRAGCGVYMHTKSLTPHPPATCRHWLFPITPGWTPLCHLNYWKCKYRVIISINVKRERIPVGTKLVWKHRLGIWFLLYIGFTYLINSQTLHRSPKTDDGMVLLQHIILWALIFGHLRVFFLYWCMLHLSATLAQIMPQEGQTMVSNTTELITVSIKAAPSICTLGNLFATLKARTRVWWTAPLSSTTWLLMPCQQPERAVAREKFCRIQCCCRGYYLGSNEGGIWQQQS